MRLLDAIDRGGEESLLERTLADMGYSFDGLARVCVPGSYEGVHVPQVLKVRFGKTGEMISILTLGGMRQQQKWGPTIQEMSQVGEDCQRNFKDIIRWAWKVGINHIETARGYGCSELQVSDEDEVTVLYG